MTATTDGTSAQLRETLTYLCKHWLLKISVDVPDHLQGDIVRKTLGMLVKTHKAASHIVLENIQEAQQMIRRCVRDVQDLVLANIT